MPDTAPRSRTVRLLRSAPSAAVLIGLAAVGYWGHRTGWSLAPTPPAAPAAEPPAMWADGSAVRFASAEAVERAGIDVAPVWRAAVTDAVSAPGDVSFDPTRVARVSARAAGTAWRVTKTVGDPVAAGEVLAVIDAAEVGKTKAELLQAIVQVRLKTQAARNLTASTGAVAEQRRREADAAVTDAAVRMTAAEQVLVNLGLPARAADLQPLSPDAAADALHRLGLPAELVRATDPGTLLPVRSPLAGVVLRADLIAGEATDPTRPAFVVADPRRVWVTLHLPVADAARVAVGRPLRFRPDGRTDEVGGTVHWIGRTADDTTRTVPVRAEVANDDGTLRAGVLGRGRVILREEPNAVVVPNAAVHALGGKAVVFVRDEGFFRPDGPKAFHSRRVHTGARDAENTEIVAGVQPGDVVATTGSGRLLDELRKTRATETDR